MKRSKSHPDFKLVIESANSINGKPIGVSKIQNCGIIRLIGQGIDVNVYEDVGSVHVQANLIQSLTVPSPQPVLNVEIDEVLPTQEGTQVRGKAIPGSRLQVFRNDQLIRQIIVNNQGNFIIDGLQSGIYRIQGNQGASAVVAISSPDGELVVSTPDVATYQHKENGYAVNGHSDPGDDIYIVDASCAECEPTKVAYSLDNGAFTFTDTNYPELVRDGTYILTARRTVNGVEYESDPFEFIPDDYFTPFLYYLQFKSLVLYEAEGRSDPGDDIYLEYYKNGQWNSVEVAHTLSDGRFYFNSNNYGPLDMFDTYKLYAERVIDGVTYKTLSWEFVPENFI